MLRINSAVAMGWPFVSGSFVPRLVIVSFSCLRTKQL